MKNEHIYENGNGAQEHRAFPLPKCGADFAGEELDDNEDFSKEDVVKAIKAFIPNFYHEEKGKNLDQKM